jgi:hypothetical protein
MNEAEFVAAAEGLYASLDPLETAMRSAIYAAPEVLRDSKVTLTGEELRRMALAYESYKKARS